MNNSEHSQAKRIALASIRLDGGTQPRAGLYHDAVEEYAADISAGATYPPVDVFHDGQDHWLAHGFHRVHAHMKAGRDTIGAIVHQGTQDDAKWFSYSANHEQDRVGLRRTNADKKRAILAAIEHPLGRTLSDIAIADHIGVDQKTVGTYRKRISGTSGDAPSTRTVTRGGKSYEMRVGKIGKRTSDAKTDATPLSAAEESQLAQLEGVIAAHLGSGAMEEGIVEDAEPATVTDPGGEPGDDREPADGDIAAGAAASIGTAEPWAEFESQILPAIATLRGVAAKLRDALGYDAKTKQVTVKWGRKMGYMGTVVVINALIRTIEDGMPSEISPSSPMGFLSRDEVQRRDARKGVTNAVSA